MPDLSVKGLANRRKGDQHSRDVTAYVRSHGFPAARRQLNDHSADIEGTGPLALECKYTTWQRVPAALDQVLRDADLRHLPRGVVIKKREGISDIGQAFWIGQVQTELAAAVRLQELEQLTAGLTPSQKAHAARVAGLEARVTDLHAKLGAAFQAGYQACQEANRGASAAGWQPTTGPVTTRPANRVVGAVGGEGAAPPVNFRSPAHPEGLPF